jgi:hypothetical protein
MFATNILGGSSACLSSLLQLWDVVLFLYVPYYCFGLELAFVYSLLLFFNDSSGFQCNLLLFL